VFHPLELVVRIVPLMNILVDVIPKGLGEVVVMRLGMVPQVVDWGCWSLEWMVTDLQGVVMVLLVQSVVMV